MALPQIGVNIVTNLSGSAISNLSRYERQLGKTQNAIRNFARDSQTGMAASSAAIAQTSRNLGQFDVATAQAARGARGLSGPLATVGAGFGFLDANLKKAIAIGAGVSLITRGAEAVVRSLGGIVTKGAEFETEMAAVRSISGATEAQFAALSQRALEVGEATQFTATEAGEGLRFLSRAGFSAEQSIGSLAATLDLSAASFGDVGVGQAANIATNALTTFGLVAGDVATQTLNTERVVDTLALTANNSNTNITQLGQALSFVGPVANQLGISVEETSAAIGALGNQGIFSTRAGRGLRQALLRILSPTEAAQTQMDALGLSFFTAQGEFIGIENSLDALGDALDANLGDNVEERGKAVDTLFETIGGSIVNALLNAGDSVESSGNAISDVLQKVNEDLDAGSTAAKIAQGAIDTLAGDYIKLQSAADSLAITLSRVVNPSLRVVTQAATRGVRAIRTLADSLIEVGLAATIRPIAPGLASLVDVISSIDTTPIRNVATNIQNIGIQAAGAVGDVLQVADALVGLTVGVATGGDVLGPGRAVFAGLDDLAGRLQEGITGALSVAGIEIDVADVVTFRDVGEDAFVFQISDFVSVVATPGTFEFNIADFVLFDATAERTTLRVGDFFEVDTTAEKTSIQVTDFFEISKAGTLFQVQIGSADIEFDVQPAIDSVNASFAEFSTAIEQEGISGAVGVATRNLAGAILGFTGFTIAFSTGLTAFTSIVEQEGLVAGLSALSSSFGTVSSEIESFSTTLGVGLTALSTIVQTQGITAGLAALSSSFGTLAADVPVMETISAGFVAIGDAIGFGPQFAGFALSFSLGLATLGTVIETQGIGAGLVALSSDFGVLGAAVTTFTQTSPLVASFSLALETASAAISTQFTALGTTFTGLQTSFEQGAVSGVLENISGLGSTVLGLRESFDQGGIEGLLTELGGFGDSILTFSTTVGDSLSNFGQTISAIDGAAISSALSSISLGVLGLGITALSFKGDVVSNALSGAGEFLTSIISLGDEIVAGFDAEAIGFDAGVIAGQFYTGLANLIADVDVGAILGEGLNLGGTLVSKILTAATSFAEGVDLPELATAGSEIFRQLASGLSDFASGPGAQEIGLGATRLVTGLVQQIGATLSDPRLGENIGEGIGDLASGVLNISTGLIAGIATGLAEIDFAGAFEGVIAIKDNLSLAISEALLEIDFSGIGDNLATTLGGLRDTLANALLDFGVGINNAIIDLPGIGDIAEQLGLERARTSVERRADFDRIRAERDAERSRAEFERRIGGGFEPLPPPPTFAPLLPTPIAPTPVVPGAADILQPGQIADLTAGIVIPALIDPTVPADLPPIQLPVQPDFAGFLPTDIPPTPVLIQPEFEDIVAPDVDPIQVPAEPVFTAVPTPQIAPIQVPAEPIFDRFAPPVAEPIEQPVTPVPVGEPTQIFGIGPISVPVAAEPVGDPTQIFGIGPITVPVTPEVAPIPALPPATLSIDPEVGEFETEYDGGLDLAVEVGDFQRDFTGTLTLNVRRRGSTGATTGDTGASIGANRTGTRFWKGGPTRIAEGGLPELVRLPSGGLFLAMNDQVTDLPAGTQILSNDNTRRALGQAPVPTDSTVNFDPSLAIPGVDLSEILNSLIETDRRSSESKSERKERDVKVSVTVVGSGGVPRVSTQSSSSSTRPGRVSSGVPITTGTLRPTGIFSGPSLTEFAMGTDSAPPGLAIVGEAGRELVIGRDGGIGMLGENGPVLASLRGGEQILTNAVTERIMSAFDRVQPYQTRASINGYGHVSPAPTQQDNSRHINIEVNPQTMNQGNINNIAHMANLLH